MCVFECQTQFIILRKPEKDKFVDSREKKGYKWTYLQNRNRLIDVENEQDYQVGEEG